MKTDDQTKRRVLELETSVSKAFMSQALGIVFDHTYYFDPSHRHAIDFTCQAYLEKTYPELDALFTESNLGRKKYFNPDQMLVGGIQPNMIIGMLLGADFIPTPDGDADITPGCWSGKPLEELPRPDTLCDHPLIRQFDEQTRSILRGGAFQPIPPFFWDASGRAAIHGTLTTAQKFLGEEVFIDMLAEPDRVRQAMDWITDVNIVLVRHFAELCGIQITAIHVGECSSCMIGNKEWEAFVVPNLNKIGATLGPIRLHSCGQSDHILESACKVERLYALDLGGETSLGKVREIFGPDLQVSIAPPVKLLANGSLDDLMAWTLNMVEANRGGCLTILYHLEPQYPLQTILTWNAWLKDLRLFENAL